MTRPESAALTPEDWYIWNQVCARWPTPFHRFAQPWTFSELSDRRDAGLMYGWMLGLDEVMSVATNRELVRSIWARYRDKEVLRRAQS